MSKIKVTGKELEVLKIMWESDQPLTSRQIHEINPLLVMSTVQSVINKLVKKDIVQVANITYSGTVLTRQYAPLISEEEFVLNQYDNLNISKLILNFLGDILPQDIPQQIDEIEKILDEKRKEI